MRRLLLRVSAIVFVDTIFFAALTPLLPAYAEEFDLSKTEAGILTAAYAAGAITAALPAGLIASRAGVKPAVVSGLAIMIVTSVVFGFAGSAWVLDAARFGQGFGSALSWNGGLAWLVAAAPRDRRGELIGVAMGAAVAGALLGPVLGGAAALVGTGAAFSAVAAFSLVLVVWTLGTPAYPPGARQPLSALLSAAVHPRVAGGIWLVTLPALLFGTIAVLAPLQLEDVGLGALAISGVFLVSTGIEALANPFLGRWSDRRGRLAPVRAGLVVAIALSLVLPWVAQPFALAAVVVAALVAYGVFWVPGTALLSDGTEEAGLEHALGFALLNFAWAPGHVVGSALGGAIADLASDAAAYVLLAAVCAATLAAIELRPLRVPAARSSVE